jgi:hypothetical protein
MNFFVDPDNITIFDRSDADLQLFLLFSFVVAGKTAITQARLLEAFMNALPEGDTPFEKIGKAVADGSFDVTLRESHLGQYGRLGRGFRESLHLDLRTCSVEDLEAIHGCGPKTARLFIMHSRPDQRIAAIDTHILKHLRTKGHEAPLNTPTAGPTYRRLETAFLHLADQAQMSPADYDLMVWKSYSRQSAAA